MGEHARSVRISEANQQFSALVQEVETTGVTIRIFRRDKPIARLSPDSGDKIDSNVRKAAVSRMKRLLKKGIAFGGERYSRDELHDRS